MKSQLFIPTKLSIGFQERNDTFTGKLAYVIYYDEKGKLRKQTSWESWRDKKIPIVELENTPRSGFVLNKGVKRYADWGSGRAMIRVHDPAGFEFEVTVDNLVGILMHSDVSKRDIMEQCVYAWAGPELVLLPVNSDAYQESVAYTQKQSQNVSTKSLVPGRQYQKKKSDEIVTYIGFYPWYEMKSERAKSASNGWHTPRYETAIRTQQSKGNRHVFHDGSSFIIPSVGTLGVEVSPTCVDNYAFLESEFLGSINGQRIVSLFVEPITDVELTCTSNKPIVLTQLNPDGAVFTTITVPYSNSDISPQNLLTFHATAHPFRVENGFFYNTTWVSDGSGQTPVTLQIPTTGVRRQFSCTEVTFSDDYSWPRKAVYSAKVIAELQRLKYGYLVAKLENGLTCPVDFR